jgi:hypothetical protein
MASPQSPQFRRFAVPRYNRSSLLLGGLFCLFPLNVVLLSGCGSSASSSAVTVSSAKEYADGARQIEENNKRHIQAALAAKKAARAKK